MREELSIDVKIERLLWLIENFFTHEGKSYHEFGFYYLVSLPADRPASIDQECFEGVEEGIRLVFKWFDNIPVLSWLLLRARCRYCREPISAQYPLVEATTGLAFVLVYYLLFVLDARVLRVGDLGAVPLEAVWPTDFCLLLAWLVLAAVLIACSAMDLILYVVDTRVTDVALGAGIVLYALWPRPDFFAERAASPVAAAAVVAFVVSGVMLWRTSRREALREQEQIDIGPAEGETRSALPTLADKLAATAAIVLFVGLAVWLLVGAANPAPNKSGAFSLAVPAAIQFQEAHEWTAVRQRCHNLLTQAIHRICTLTGLPSIYPDDSTQFYHQMATIPLPLLRAAEAFKAALLQQFKVEVPIVTWNGRSFIRVSVQAYNSPADIDLLLEALRNLLPKHIST